MVSDFHGLSAHSFRSVSTVSSEILQEGFNVLSRICVVFKAPESYIISGPQSKCFKSYLPAIEYELNKLCAKMSCLSFD